MAKLLNLKSLSIAIFILVAALGATQLVLANGMSGEGQKIRDLEAQRAQLQNEIQILEKEVSTLGALSRIQTQAAELGFSWNPQAFEYISSPKLAQAQ